MKVIRVIVSAIALLSSVAASAQFRSGSYSDIYDSETVSAVKGHVRELSSAMYEGRKAGSEGEKMAAEYVESQLRAYGVDVLSPK